MLVYELNGGAHAGEFGNVPGGGLECVGCVVAAGGADDDAFDAERDGGGIVVAVGVAAATDEEVDVAGADGELRGVEGAGGLGAELDGGRCRRWASRRHSWQRRAHRRRR